MVDSLHLKPRDPGLIFLGVPLALQLATSHSYDLGPAERDFGYVERVSMSEATRITIESLRAATL